MEETEIQDEKDLPGPKDGQTLVIHVRLSERHGLWSRWCKFLARKYGQPVEGFEASKGGSFPNLWMNSRIHGYSLWSIRLSPLPDVERLHTSPESLPEAFDPRWESRVDFELRAIQGVGTSP